MCCYNHKTRHACLGVHACMSLVCHALTKAWSQIRLEISEISAKAWYFIDFLEHFQKFDQYISIN